MAGKDINEVVTKFTNEGLDKLDQASASMKGVAENVDKLQKNVNGFRATIIANQIQDIAVQMEMGTNMTRILAQQLPQLGTAFGPMGAAAGAVAAIFFGLLNPALRMFGIDIRNSKEMSDDLNTTLDNLRKTQMENLPTVEGLVIKYGDLAQAVKNFNQVSQDSNQKFTNISIQAQIEELRKRFTFFGDDVDTAFKKAIDAGGGLAPALGASLLYLKFTSGLTTEQIQILGKNLKDLGPNPSNERLLEVITKIKTELANTKISPSQIQDLEALIKQLDTSARSAKDLNENLNAAADASSKFNTENLQNQLAFFSKMGAAARENRQGDLANLQTQQRLKEIDIERNRLRQEGKLTAFAEAELAAKENLARGQGVEKQRDFAKTQMETFNSQMLSNDAKRDQLVVQDKLLKLQMEQIDGISYTKMLDEARLKNVLDHQQALLNINELLRKNQITEEQAGKLRQQANEVRNQQDKVAETSARKIIAENERTVRLTVEQLDKANDQRQRALEIEMRTFGMSTRQRDYIVKQLQLQEEQLSKIYEIENNSRLSAEEKALAIETINFAYDKGLRILKAEREYRKDLDASYEKGAKERIMQIQESFTPFKQGGMIVDSVFNQMSSSIDTFVETGKFKFGDFARSIIMDIEKILLKAALINFLKAGASSMGFAIPGLASGGGVQGGSPYLVGEQGPELFVPSTGGSIIPNNRLGGGVGGNTYITNNITAMDSKSVAQVFAENRMSLLGTVEQARRELPLRTR